jgi:cytochrome d ubiquinol oxidase subunit I
MISPALHLAAGIGVAASGAASAFFVTLVNAFMNGPAAAAPSGLDPTVAMWSPSWPYQTVHVLISCYQATAWTMVGIHALFLLRDPTRALHRKALGLALPIACVTALIQPLAGDRAAKHLAVAQPLKLAAAEAHLHTQPRAALHLGGLPDLATGEFHGAIAIPRGLSFLAHGDLDATVTGLEAFSRADWPPVLAVRSAFQTMVGAGTAMACLAAALILARWRRRRWPDGRRWLWALAIAGPLGFVSLEAGWLVTEWGRQPWIVHGYLRTADAVTEFPYKAAPFWLFTIVYLLLGAAVAYLLWRQLIVADAPARSGEADVH